MTKSKGCFNKKCSNFFNKVFLDKKSNICPECGEKTYYVCKHEGCFKKIDDNQKYCVTHKELHKNKMQKIGSEIATIVVAVVATVATAKKIKK